MEEEGLAGGGFGGGGRGELGVGVGVRDGECEEGGEGEEATTGLGGQGASGYRDCRLRGVGGQERNGSGGGGGRL